MSRKNKIKDLDSFQIRRELERRENALTTNIPTSVPVGFSYETQYPDAIGWFAEREYEFGLFGRQKNKYVLKYGGYNKYKPERYIPVTSALLRDFLDTYTELKIAYEQNGTSKKTK